MNTLFKNSLKAFVLIGLFSALLGITAPTAHANVTITPNILLIEEGTTRYADLTLINTGKEPTTYEMKWLFFKMADVTGQYQAVNASLTPFDLSKHIIYTPRRITLGPNSSQKVRLALRLNGENPPPGDYRAHFELREVPKSNVESTPDNTVAVRMNISFSLPVIYRVGKPTSAGHITSVKTGINKQTGHLEAVVTIDKTPGPYGVLGRIEVYHTPKGGTEQRVGSVSNAHMFPEVNSRVLPVVLKTNDLTDGTLRVVFKDQRAEVTTIYDQKVLQIGN